MIHTGVYVTTLIAAVVVSFIVGNDTAVFKCIIKVKEMHKACVLKAYTMSGEKKDGAREIIATMEAILEEISEEED